MELFEEIHNCKRCASIRGRKCVVLDGKKIPSDFGVPFKRFRLVFVVESPPVSGVYLWNPKSKSIVRDRLFTQLVKAGLMRSGSLNEFGEKYYYTDAVKCPFEKNGENASPPMKAIENCRSFLLREIEHCKPEVVCTLGKTPLKSFLRVKRFKLGDLAGKIVPESYLRHDVGELKCKIFSSWFPTSMVPETLKVEAMKTLKDLLE